MGKNIVLIGFMGAGKSAVGVGLAKELNFPLIDTDTLIEERTGKKIKDIFAQEGERAFRKIESQVVKEISAREDHVIAGGGGVVLDPENVQMLKENSTIVYLKADPEVIVKRTAGAHDRPLLEVPTPETEVRRLLFVREKIYQEVADVVVDTSNLSIEDVVKEVMAKVGGNSQG
jgi:shikimate kinase